MHDRVYKYGPFLPSETPQPLELPVASEILHFAAMEDGCYIWALVNPEELEKEKRTIAIIGTGWDVPNWYVYRFTAITQNGFVWHLFEGSLV